MSSRQPSKKKIKQCEWCKGNFPDKPVVGPHSVKKNRFCTLKCAWSFDDQEKLREHAQRQETLQNAAEKRAEARGPEENAATSAVKSQEEVEKSRLRLGEKVAIMAEKVQRQRDLPFLYAWKWYTWAREFYESTNKINLLCAANQISKSSTQIRKCINWATNQELWPSLWGHRPNQFWYLYPTGKQAMIEFQTKWKQFLPSERMKDDPVYGWKVDIKNKELVAIHFNSGVHVYFKTYSQDSTALQTGTVDAIFCDEELPEALYDELIFRISASNGYFHMVFTATLAQEFWRKCMEPGKTEKENLPEARKWTISAYDCLYYEDGTKSHWSLEKIKVIERRCKSHSEVLKRVYGRFVKEQGRKYPQFDIKRHMKPKHKIPPNWLVYGGVDIGSGGTKGHPSAIVFVAVKPDMTTGRVFLGWRGDGIPTTAGDVVKKFIEMRTKGNIKTTAQYYDWGSKDFDMISVSMNEPFMKAEKDHEIGEQVINTLFKNDMLFIYEDEDDPELAKLAAELATLLIDTSKKIAKDDFADAFRYAVTKIPWDWSVIREEEPGSGKAEEELTDMEKEVQERMKQVYDANKEYIESIEDEFEEWNEHYG